MKILELTRPKINKTVANTAFDYFNQRKEAYDSHSAYAADNILDTKLKKLGWKKLGAGVYSHVFINSAKPYVLKVNKRQDKGYMAYVSLIKKSRNPHFPKISDQKMLEVLMPDGKGTRANYYVYLIEKLLPIKDDEAVHVAYDLERIIINHFLSLEQIFSNKDRNSIGPIGGKIPFYIANNPLLVKACRIIGKNANTLGVRSDMHESNIMERVDGTLVITDPYASKAD